MDEKTADPWYVFSAILFTPNTVLIIDLNLN